MTAVALLARARDAGVHVRAIGGDLRLHGRPDGDLVRAMREAKPELIGILRGNRCRLCGKLLAWPAPAGIVFADHTAECMACADREVGRILAAAERVVAPELANDPGELMLQPGGLS